MNIAIDLTPLPSQRTGVGQYARELLRLLEKFDKENQYWVFLKKYQSKDFVFKNEHFHLVLCSNILKHIFFRILWEQLILPIHLLKKNIHLLHSIHYTIPFFVPSKRVVTFHDMTFFLFPKEHLFIKKIFFRIIIPFSAKKADRIIAVSQNTKNDIQKILNIEPEKIEVVPVAISPVYRVIKNNDEINKIKRKYGILDGFILFVGTLEPRKNVIGLIKAYQGLISKKGIEHQLVIVGKKGWNYQEIFNTVKKLHLTKKIIFTGYIPENELVFLYNAADLFVYPSLYEGFGIPPSEALACGAPVISSNVSSIPEVVGDAGILVNPDKIEEIAQAMYKVLTDKKLSSQLREKGPKKAKEFSEEKFAKAMIKIYKKTAKL